MTKKFSSEKNLALETYQGMGLKAGRKLDGLEFIHSEELSIKRLK